MQETRNNGPDLDVIVDSIARAQEKLEGLQVGRVEAMAAAELRRDLTSAMRRARALRVFCRGGGAGG